MGGTCRSVVNRGEVIRNFTRNLICKRNLVSERPPEGYPAHTHPASLRVTIAPFSGTRGSNSGNGALLNVGVGGMPGTPPY